MRHAPTSFTLGRGASYCQVEAPLAGRADEMSSIPLSRTPFSSRDHLGHTVGHYDRFCLSFRILRVPSFVTWEAVTTV